MSNRDILSISPIAYNWYEDNKGIVIVENYYNKRRIFLEEEQLSKLWKIIMEDSDYERIKKKFFEFGEDNFEKCLNLLKKVGIIKVNYFTKVTYGEKKRD